MPLAEFPPLSLPPSPAEVEAALPKANPTANPVSVACSFVLVASGFAESAEVYAVVSSGAIAFAAGAEICVDGWNVCLLSDQSPIGRAVCDAAPAGLGDCVTVRLPGSEKATYEAQIVSWNGSPLLSDAERSDCRDKQARRKADAQARAEGKRKKAALCAKQDGTVANLRARRKAKEAEWRDAMKRVE